MKPFFSILIATRNRARYLNVLLGELARNPIPDAEIVIVDGASTDSTKDIVRSFGVLVSTFVSEPDRCEAEAFNKAVGLAKGEILKPITDDDFFPAEMFSVARSEFEEDPSLNVLFGLVRYRFLEGTRAAKEWADPPAAERELCSASLWLRSIPPANLGPRPQSITAFVRRRVYDQVGLYSLKDPAIDIDYWYRCARAGMKMRQSTRYRVTYNIHAGSGVMVKPIKKWWLLRALRYGRFFEFLFNYRNEYGVLYPAQRSLRIIRGAMCFFKRKMIG